MALFKPYYENELGRLYCGDCLTILPYLEPVDLVLTDPPYGISHPCNFKERGRGKLAKCKNYSDVIGDNHPFDPSHLFCFKNLCLWGANNFSSKLQDSTGWLVWDKLRPDTLDQSTCELAWTNFVKGCRRFKYLWNGMIRESHEQLTHPTEKPVALMLWVISLQWTPVGLVADPYLGTGATAVACERLKRRWIGIEIEEKYCAIAVKRIEAERRQLKLF